MKEKKKILICPLDWGLGHATRCIPIIQELLKRGCDVQIASSSEALTLLKTEFPDLIFYNLTGYRPRYSTSTSLILPLALQMPKFVRAIRAEHKEVETIIRQNGISLVISDNRFGCWSSKIPCVMITHQLQIKLPKWLSGIVNAANRHHIKKFTTCWVPDWEGSSSLSRELSADPGFPVTYIGPLSRFHKIEGIKKKYEVVAILSGPEPQRTIFEEIVRKELKKSEKHALLIRGLPALIERKKDGNLEEVTHLNSGELNQVILEAEIIVSRPGYSTIMDLAKLGMRALFIPTPGQTEQEYLGRELMKKGIAYQVAQDHFDLEEALGQAQHYTGFKMQDANELLLTALNKSGL